MFCGLHEYEYILSSSKTYYSNQTQKYYFQRQRFIEITYACVIEYSLGVISSCI